MPAILHVSLSLCLASACVSKRGQLYGKIGLGKVERLFPSIVSAIAEQISTISGEFAVLHVLKASQHTTHLFHTLLVQNSELGWKFILVEPRSRLQLMAIVHLVVRARPQ